MRKKTTYKTIVIDNSSIADKENVQPYLFEAEGKTFEAKYRESYYDLHNNVIDVYAYWVKEGKIKGHVGSIEFFLDRSNGYLRQVTVTNLDFPFWEQKAVFDNEEDALLAAEKIAPKYIDVEEFDRKNYMRDGLYIVEYNRYVDGVISEEQIEISFSSTEPIFMSLHINKPGKYKNVTLGNFDVEEGEKIALEKMKELHGEGEYLVKKREMCTVEGKLGINYTCDKKPNHLGELLLGEIIFVYLD